MNAVYRLRSLDLLSRNAVILCRHDPPVHIVKDFYHNIFAFLRLLDSPKYLVFWLMILLQRTQIP